MGHCILRVASCPVCARQPNARKRCPQATGGRRDHPGGSPATPNAQHHPWAHNDSAWPHGIVDMVVWPHMADMRGLAMASGCLWPVVVVGGWRLIALARGRTTGRRRVGVWALWLCCGRRGTQSAHSLTQCSLSVP
jgi:hypothetical protein